MRKFFTFSLLITLSLIACSKDSVKVGDDSDIIGSETFKTIMPKNGVIEDPDHGRETWFSIGPIAGVEGTPANGVAIAQMFEDGTYTLSLQVNIERPLKGSFYEAWLESEESDLVSAGHLSSIFGDVRHQLAFASEQDLRSRRKVVVSLEADDGNPAPAKRVAEAELRKRKR